jgi:hypothetical protein
MAVYEPVRHQKNIIWTPEASVHIIFFWLTGDCDNAISYPKGSSIFCLNQEIKIPIVSVLWLPLWYIQAFPNAGGRKIENKFDWYFYSQATFVIWPLLSTRCEISRYHTLVTMRFSCITCEKYVSSICTALLFLL